MHHVVDEFCDALRLPLQSDSRFIEFERLVVATREFITTYGHFVSILKLKELCELDVVTLSEAERVANLLTHELSVARAKLPSFDEIAAYRAQTHTRDQQGMERLRTLIALCPFCDSSLEFHEKTNAYECRMVTQHHPLMIGVEKSGGDIRHTDFYYSDLDSLCTSGVLQKDGIYRVSLPRDNAIS